MKTLVLLKNPWVGFVLAGIVSITLVKVYIPMGVPLPALLGALSGHLIIAVSGFRIQDPAFYDPLTRASMGVLVGTTFTPEIVAYIPDMAKSLALVPPFVFVIGYAGFAFLRLVGFDRTSAFYAAMPGGLHEMPVMAKRAGVYPWNMSAIRLVHATRVLVILAVVPFAIEMILGVRLHSFVGSQTAEVPISEMALMLISGVVGWLVAARIGLPGAAFVGPLILTALCTLSGLINSLHTQDMFFYSQYLIAMFLGMRFSGYTFKELRIYVAAGVAYVVFIGVLSLVLIIVITRLLGLEPLDALIAFLPGGQPEMAVMAVASISDVAFVATHHVFRVLLVVFFVQLLLRRVNRH